MSAQEEGNMSDDGISYRGGLNEDDVDEARVEQEFQEEYADFDALGARSRNVDVDLMRKALLNEKGAPEILPYEALLVKHLKEAVERQQDLVEEMQRNVRLMMQALVYQMELDRVNYLVVEYLRTRLRKIEKYAFFLVKDENMMDLLSAAEQKFVRRFADLQASHMRKLALSKMPTVHQKLGDQNDQVNMIPEPNLDTFVLCRVQEDLGDVEVDPHNLSEPAHMQTGDLFAIRYRPIKDLVKNGSIALM